MTIALYGIKNCDTMKKARAWLDANAIRYVFHDYKAEGVDPARLDHWIAAQGWEPLLNRAGTTFRKLPEIDKTDLDSAKARALMIAQPSMIKRPVLENDGEITVGFKPGTYASIFGK
jgi:Spx/MgsR family transcriptional regulator